MKKVLAITCLLVLLTLVLGAMASAQTQPQWRFNLKADSGAGMNSNGAMTIGTYSSSKDGFGADGLASDGQDAKSNIATAANTRGVVAALNNTAWIKDVKSPRVPLDPAYNAGQPGPNGSILGVTPNYESNRKIWDLRVWCNPLADPNTTGDITRLTFTTIGAPIMPPAVIGPGPLKYWLRMVDNKGIEGAPANGTVWEIPVPTVHSTTVPYFTLTLPNRVISVASEAAVLDEGYKMQFFQTPEPSSMLALGAGLMGLAGFASRRRRS